MLDTDPATHQTICEECPQVKDVSFGPCDFNGSKRRSIPEDEGGEEENVEPSQKRTKLTKRRPVSPSAAITPVRETLAGVSPGYMNLPGFGSGGPIPSDRALWVCLCCGVEGCPYENGVTIMREEDEAPLEEHDLRGEAMEKTAAKWSRSDDDMLEEAIAIRKVVLGLLCSKKFFGNNTYIGTPSLDRKLKE